MFGFCPVPALLPPSALVQAQSLKIEAHVHGSPAVGANHVLVTVRDPSGKPVAGAQVSMSTNMAEMDMGVGHATATDDGGGEYSASLDFGMAGTWKVTVRVAAPGFATTTREFTFKASEGSGHEGHQGHEGHDMHGTHSMSGMLGRLGPWSMQKEGSGTSWLPANSPMFMKPLPAAGRYELNAMGFITFDESGTGGPRGHSRFYSNSMLMLMGRRETGGGTLGLNLMLSLDPIFNGEYGYPNLFQTGETAHGHALVDYQHPHDLVAEMAASYSHPIGGGYRAFAYGGPVGEPALGGPTFMHRPSGMEIPEAPISHHWFDSTHISWGVATLGVNNARWQVEGSAFNGHEPNENRYSPDPLALNSSSGRVTFNPSRDWSFNASYGFLDEPEATAPGVGQHRLTGAALWSHALGRDTVSATLAFGRRMQAGMTSDAVLAEATYLRGSTSWYARWEHVMEDELVGVPAATYMVNKFLVGAVENFARSSGLELGLGAYAGFYVFPSSLNAYYGHSPVTLGVYLRIRPSRMRHEMP